MAEDRIQHHLLSRDQLIHIRLGIVIEHGAALRMPHAALDCFDVGLLFGDEERCQAVAQVVKPRPLALFELHPRLDWAGVLRPAPPDAGRNSLPV